MFCQHLLIAYLIVLTAGGLGLIGLLGAGNIYGKFEESWVRRGFGVYMTFTVALSWFLAIALWQDADQVATAEINEFLSWKVSMTSAFLLAITNTLVGVIGHFSSFYLHREAGFRRYFFFYLLFFLGINANLSANGSLLMILGWEWVGLSSVMLIGFFIDREGPMRQARYVFGVYRIADVALLIGITMMFLEGHNETLPILGISAHAPLPASGAWIMSFLALAAAIKGAQYPFTAYLVRSMEGPTASSAAFYGALSVHMGPLLLLRFSPWMRELPILSGVLVVVGLVTAVLAVLSGRVRTDVKGQLAYAAAGHLGIIFVEIGFGWYHLAFWHCLSHMALRTSHFLSSPSYLQLKARWALHHMKHQRRFQSVPIGRLSSRLYWSAVSGFDVLETLRFYVMDPVWRVAQSIDCAEARWQKYFAYQAPDAPRPIWGASEPQSASECETTVSGVH